MVHPSANAEMVKRQWNNEEGEFPRKRVGEWFTSFRKDLKKKLLVCIKSLSFISHWLILIFFYLFIYNQGNL